MRVGAARRARSPGRNTSVPRRVLSALIFFPRGGSSHVARSLGRELPAHGWDVTILSGSKGGHGDARRFYRGLDPKVVDFDAPGVPMHPSYEDRPDAPDPVFARLGEAAFERQVGTWGRALLRAGARDADVLHLHHLTPIHEAAERVAPEVPVVGHLHGTELLMLEEIAEGPPAGWDHAVAWSERMARWAQRCERLIVLSQTQIERAEAALGIDPDRCVVLPNGFDPVGFRRRDIDRPAFWREHLGDPLEGAAVVLSVSRFTAVKRLPLLVEAFAQARERVGRRAALVIVGGHEGEHEGEHPRDAIQRVGAQDVFLAGWHDHDVLPEFLSASDVLALASVREQFGQVLVEAMACEVPPIAVDRFGPTEIIQPGETGWLVEPDDRDDLARALAEAIDDDAERRRRGAAARADAEARFSWPALAGQLAETLDDVAGVRPPTATRGV
jgi:glycosyltransferase involved in cell wall biosynthesis